MTDLLLSEAAKRGYVPDVSVCATGHYAFGNRKMQGPSGFGKMQGPLLGFGKDISRPKPAMCNLNAYLLDVSDNAVVVKVGDTLDDIREGKRAGMWTIALAGTGNEMYLTEEHDGMTEEQIRRMDQEGYRKKLTAAYSSMITESPDFIVDSIREVPNIIAVINARLKTGSRPW